MSLHDGAEPGGWGSAIDGALRQRIESHSFRQRRLVTPIDAAHVEIDGRRLTNFSSNDYLGLTHHPRVVSAFSHAAETCGVGAGAAALISGFTPAHASAERTIAGWKKCESAVLLSSGYAANLAAVQTLAAAGSIGGGAVAGDRSGGGAVRFLLDKLAHASLVDAVRSVAKPHGPVSYRVFPHNHLPKLARLLSEAPAGQLQVVISESIFSMDGDAADLAGLAELKRQHRFLLLLDEAHGTGVYGAGGAGLAAERGLGSLADVTVLTLSKAVGVAGGAICASARFCDAVVNFGRALIYSTNLPAAVAAGAVAAIGVMRDEPQRQQRVRQLAISARARLAAAGICLPPGDSPILPIPLPSESASLQAAVELESAGFLVTAIRPPTVPSGGSRLRITLSSEHTDSEVDALLAAVEQLQQPRSRGPAAGG
jgi:8-amino-7-oxononanoate synthase